MDTTKAAALLAVGVVLVGCASSPMRQEHYERFGKFAARAQKCFEAGYIDPKLNADAKNAFAVLLNTWTYDSAKMRSMAEFEYQRTNANLETCRTVESDAHQLVSLADQHRQNLRENERAVNDAVSRITIPKPIYCNTIGTMTMCN